MDSLNRTKTIPRYETIVSIEIGEFPFSSIRISTKSQIFWGDWSELTPENLRDIKAIAYREEPDTNRSVKKVKLKEFLDDVQNCLLIQLGIRRKTYVEWEQAVLDRLNECSAGSKGQLSL